MHLFYYNLVLNNVYILGFGIACLQSSVPISLMLIQKALPNMPATATSLSLGTSIALAGLPLFLLKNNTIVQYWFMNKWLWVLITLFCAFLWYKIHRFKWAQNLIIIGLKSNLCNLLPKPS
ncbi:MAG: hypothetical protein V9E96_09885 [Chitinophagaceae bacterium]